MGKFEGKVAVVTGGAWGIGGATARKLASEGAKVTIADIDDDAINTASSMSIRGVPTVVILKKGQEVSRKVGGVPETHMREFLKENL